MAIDPYDDGTVKVIEGSGIAYLDQAERKQRSEPQKHIDHALDTALELATKAHEMVAEAVEWLETVTPSKNRNTPVIVGQLVAEIVEVKRVRQ